MYRRVQQTVQQPSHLQQAPWARKISPRVPRHMQVSSIDYCIKVLFSKKPFLVHSQSHGTVFSGKLHFAAFLYICDSMNLFHVKKPSLHNCYRFSEEKTFLTFIVDCSAVIINTSLTPEHVSPCTADGPTTKSPPTGTMGAEDVCEGASTHAGEFN